MNKIKLTLIGIISLIFLPNVVHAADFNLILECNNTVNQGETITCKVKGTASEGTYISSITANVSVTGVGQVTSIEKASNWSALESTTSSFYFLTDSKEGIAKTFDLATITINTTQAGVLTLKLTNIVAVDTTYETIDAASVQRNISVIAPTTAPTTKTTRTTTSRTTKPITSITTRKITEIVTTQPIVIPLKLNSVSVDNFEVTYENGIYFATVDSRTDKVTITATADPTIEIVGQGQRALATGKNVVELIIKNSADQTATIQVVITRPEDKGTHDVSLYKLKIVNYDFDFYKNKTDYDVSIPYNINEVFIFAESNNPDVTITGAGVKKLESGSNDLVINVKYGDIANQKYTIHVKRDYTGLLMIFGIIASLGGLFISFIYFLIQKKKLVGEKEYEVNKALAAAKRQMETLNPTPYSPIEIPEEKVKTFEDKNPTEVLEIVTDYTESINKRVTSTYPEHNTSTSQVVNTNREPKVIKTNRPTINIITSSPNSIPENNN